jgi:hypothetical protein
MAAMWMAPMMGQQFCPYDGGHRVFATNRGDDMSVGHEFGQAPASNDRVLPSWRVVLSAWLVVGVIVLLALGVHAAASRVTVSNDPGASAPLVIPRHAPGCGTDVPVVVNDCAGTDPALVLPYSQF